MPSVQRKESRATASGLDSPARTKVAIVTGASRGMPGSHEVIFTNPGGLAEKLIEAGRD